MTVLLQYLHRTASYFFAIASGRAMLFVILRTEVSGQDKHAYQLVHLLRTLLFVIAAINQLLKENFPFVARSVSTVDLSI